MGNMNDAYLTAAESYKEQVEPDKDAYKRLLTQKAVVVRGCYDHTERVLDALGLSFRAIPPEALATLEIPSEHPLFINCPGYLPSDSIRWLRKWVETDGGCVVTTDWALPNCVQKAFPGFIEHNGRSTTDDVVSVAVAPEGRAMLGDLIEADDDPMIYPSIMEIEKSIVAYSDLGLQVMITELDVSVLPWPDLLPGAEVSSRFQYRPELDPYKEDFPDKAQKQLANRYAEIFAIFVKHSNKIARITFWGINDGTSWKNNFPVRGRTDFPLLFDRAYRPKPAFYSVVDLVKTD